MDLKLAQWNCRGLRDKFRLNYIDYKSIDILCILETLLSDKVQLSHKDFRIIRQDSQLQNNRGLCFLIRNHILFSTIIMDRFAHPSVEIQGFTIHINDKIIFIVNLYKHPATNTPSWDWDNLFALKSRYPLMLVIGDYNAHHSYWHCSRCDSEGEKLVKALDNANMLVLNDGQSTFMNPSVTNTNVIDLSIASGELALLCESFTGSDSWGSDHFLIFTKIEGML